MEIILSLIDFIIHIGDHLGELINQYGRFTYIILFLIVFAETGLVFCPLLPGDSLLFAAGAFAARGDLDIRVLYVVFLLAPTLGDQSNYWIGRLLGKVLPFKYGSLLFNKKYLDKTEEFYARHGVKTIIIARFVPIVRTFAPFVAGLGRMKFLRFVPYSLLGTCLWALAFVTGGYFFGNMPFIKNNFTLTIFAIIFISLLPGIVEWWRTRKKV